MNILTIFLIFLVCSALLDIADPFLVSGVRLTDGNVAHIIRMQSLLSVLYPILQGIKGINKMYSKKMHMTNIRQQIRKTVFLD